jgi:hypothetical protein
MPDIQRLNKYVNLAFGVVTNWFSTDNDILLFVLSPQYYSNTISFCIV